MEMTEIFWILIGVLITAISIGIAWGGCKLLSYLIEVRNTIDITDRIKCKMKELTESYNGLNERLKVLEMEKSYEEIKGNAETAISEE